MATPAIKKHRSLSRPAIASTSSSPRLLHRQLAGSKRQSSDTDHLQAPPKAYRVSPQALSLDYLLDSVSSDVAIISELELTRCTDVPVIVIIGGLLEAAVIFFATCATLFSLTIKIITRS